MFYFFSWLEQIKALVPYQSELFKVDGMTPEDEEEKGFEPPNVCLPDMVVNVVWLKCFPTFPEYWFVFPSPLVDL